MKPVPRVESYRGFVFASLAPEGEDLATSLGEAAANIDNMVDRAPAGELEIFGGCYRTLQRNNWKVYLENLHDGMHAPFVHSSSIHAGRASSQPVVDAFTPFRLGAIAANGVGLDKMGD